MAWTSLRSALAGGVIGVKAVIVSAVISSNRGLKNLRYVHAF